MDFNSELWGRDRMLEAAKRFVDCSADHVVRNVLAFRRRFSGLARQLDDTSLIAVKVGQPRRDQSTCDCGFADTGKSPAERPVTSRRAKSGA
jgi:hypothetical protein